MLMHPGGSAVKDASTVRAVMATGRRGNAPILLFNLLQESSQADVKKSLFIPESTNDMPKTQFHPSLPCRNSGFSCGYAGEQPAYRQSGHQSVPFMQLSATDIYRPEEA